MINITNKEDKIVISKILDKIRYTKKNYEESFSDFLPMQKYLEFLDSLRQEARDLQIIHFGGYEEAERIMLGFFLEYMEVENENFPIGLLEIEYNPKYSNKLSHRNFLGSILGLGIDRAKVGDIVLKDNKAICFLAKDIIDYVNVNLEKVGSSKVKTKIVDINNYELPKPNLEEKNIIISSLRLDAVLSGAFNIARGKIADYIKGEKVFVNFTLQTNGAKQVKDGDIITLRGAGRIKVLSPCGKTKKDRIVLSIAKYI